MRHLHKDKQSLRRDGGSAFSKLLRRITHPWCKLSLTAAYLLAVAVLSRLGIGCVWLRLFKIPCPGCGMTRAYASLLRGELSAAFSYHFMFPTVPLIYLYILFDGRLFRRAWINGAVLSVLLCGFLLHWALLLVAAG